MNIKRFFKEDKGGFGVFLILVIMGLAIYAFQREDPARDYDITYTETEAESDQLTTTVPEYTRQAITKANLPNPVTNHEAIEAKADSMAAREAEKEPVKPEVAAAETKTKSKTKPKPVVKKKMTRNELIRRKLKAGMTVRQVAKATGIDKKYIRDLKRKENL